MTNKKTDTLPLHNNFVKGSQENLQKKENSLTTSSPNGSTNTSLCKVERVDWLLSQWQDYKYVWFIPDWMFTEKFVIISHIVLICILLPQLILSVWKLLRIRWIL